MGKIQRQEVERKTGHEDRVMNFRHEQETAKLKPRTVSECKGADKESRFLLGSCRQQQSRPNRVKMKISLWQQPEL